MRRCSSGSIITAVTVAVATLIVLPSPVHAQVPHKINDFRAGRAYVGDVAGAWDLGRERSADHSTWGWPEADPGTIELDDVPAVLDVPYGLPTPPALPGGDSSYNALPEPGSAVLLGLAAALALRRRR